MYRYDAEIDNAALRWPVTIACLVSLVMVWTLAALLPSDQPLRIGVNVACGLINVLTLAIGWRWGWQRAGYVWVWQHFVCTSIVYWSFGVPAAPNQMMFVILVLFSAWVLGARTAIAVALASLVLMQTLVLRWRWNDGDLWVIMKSEIYETFFFAGALCMTTLIMLSLQATYRRKVQQTESVRSELLAQQQATHQFHQAVEQNPDAMLLINYDGTVRYANAAFLQQWGFELADVVGKRSADVSLTNISDEERRALRAQLDAGQVWHQVLHKMRRDGSPLVEAVTIAPVHDEVGKVSYFIEIKKDMTELLRTEERLRELEVSDTLTGLLNRNTMLRELETIITAQDVQTSDEQRRRPWHGFVLLNLDRFKSINDALGAQAGDRVLNRVARCIQSSLPPNFSVNVARMGGDEFGVLIRHAGDLRKDARLVCQSMVTVMQSRIQSLDVAHGKAGEADSASPDIRLSVSGGATVFPFVAPGAQCDNASDVVRRASLAVNAAKHRGRARIELFNEEMASAVMQRFDIEHSLRDAIARGELRLYVQSKVDHSDAVAGMEALVRWIHPSKGFVSPAVFIPVAEESHLIVDIGDWVMDESCRVLADPRMLAHGWSLSVNVAAQQFREDAFVDKVVACLKRHGANPDKLVLELTERVILEPDADAFSKIQALRGLGVKFSLDDFGTGYSSLSYLQRLPVQELKIDQSFVRELGSAQNVMLVHAILNVAAGFQLSVVAEGVETAEQAAQLRAMAPDILLQGYHFARPTEAQEWLVAHAGPATA